MINDARDFRAVPKMRLMKSQFIDNDADKTDLLLSLMNCIAHE